ncbi:MAG: hypothetical protein ACYC8T_38710 [Myxococcaceae bacterium]
MHALAIGASGFFLANVYFTWFKFAGAALFLTGARLLLEDPRGVFRWALSGLLFGLACTLHLGNLLGLPLLVGWLSVRAMRGSPRRWRAALGPLLLCAGVVGFQLPWGVVKAVYLHSDNTLLVQHFFDGRHHPRGVLASAAEFGRETPLRRQLTVRLGRLGEAFRARELREWASQFGARRLREQLKVYTALELRHVAILFYPALAFLAAAGLDARRRRRGDGPAPGADSLLREERWLVLLSAATVLALVLSTYGVFEPDLNHSLPNGPILLSLLMVNGWILRRGGPVAAAYLVFAAASWVRVLASV